MDSSNRIFAGDIHNLKPVLIRPSVDFLRSPQKFDIRHLHACCPPHFNEVLSNSSNLLQVSIKFSVQHGEVVRDPEDEDGAGIDHLVDVDGPQQSLGDVHAAGRLKAVVAPDELLPEEAFLEELLADDLAPD